MVPSLPRLGAAKRGDLLRDLRLRGFPVQASEVSVVPEEALVGPATRCRVPRADDAVAPKTAHVAPAELAWFGPRYGVSELPEICRCVEPMQLSLHTKPTILQVDSDAPLYLLVSLQHQIPA